MPSPGIKLPKFCPYCGEAYHNSCPDADMADDVNERSPEMEEEEVTEVQDEVPPPPEEYVREPVREPMEKQEQREPMEPMEPMKRASETREPLLHERIPEEMEPPRAYYAEQTPELVAGQLRERTGPGNGPMFVPSRMQPIVRTILTTRPVVVAYTIVRRILRWKPIKKPARRIVVVPAWAPVWTPVWKQVWKPVWKPVWRPVWKPAWRW